VTHYTVQCGYAAYYTNTVTVEAASLDEALEKAVAEANQSPSWSSTDYSGPTFIEVVAKGDDVDLWMDDHVHQLPVPPRFTENGEGPRITVIVSGGVVQDVEVKNGPARVHVHDYDVGDAAPGDPNIQTDAEGEPYALADWSEPNSAPARGGMSSNQPQPPKE
jgi:hypothetical protein